jgi:ribulose-phosphate 3-epimerase
VMPGFGGQKFDTHALKHISKIREMTDPNMLISVDGGIQADTIGACARAGANVFVTGSALFSHPDYGKFIEEMTALATVAKKERIDI